MTTEQQKVLHRCKSMIKTAFPSMTGKYIFVLNSRLYGLKGITVGRFEGDLKIPEPSKEVTKLQL